jgi:two-component system, NtrC family, response regulator HydG
VDNSPAMMEVYNLIENVGKVDTTVLITGESGTGKELTAEALHAESPRRGGSLIKVDCASIPEDLLESELFGHRKGAFTGADRDRTGRILQADGGTLFLDEIGDISPRLQLRLLRFLQERTFYPVGRDTPLKVDVRVITATNADLQDKVNRGLFREDLFYRLRVIEINLPPLRARREGIPLLVNHFLEKFSAKLNREINGISDQAMQAPDQLFLARQCQRIAAYYRKGLCPVQRSDSDYRLLPARSRFVPQCRGAANTACPCTAASAAAPPGTGTIP